MKNSNIIHVLKSFLRIIFFTMIGWAAAFAQTKGQANPNSKDKPVETYSYHIISSSNNTWGYDILVNNKTKIHQPVVPGQPGVAGFKTKASAEAAATLVIAKIKNGEVPPTLFKHELEKIIDLKN